MHVATLIATPGGLVPSRADALRAAWSGGPLRWLAPREAAEFPTRRDPEDLWDAWEGLQAEGVDLLVQPAENRRKKMLLADMDSTMIRQECIDEVDQREQPAHPERHQEDDQQLDADRAGRVRAGNRLVGDAVGGYGWRPRCAGHGSRA